MNKIHLLENQIKQKDEEINKLKEQFKKKKIDLNRYMKDEIICVTFQNPNFTFSVPCVKEDIFAEIEEKLYQEYNELRETDNYFICNGNKVKRFKNIEENNIKNNNIVLFFKGDDA